MNAQPHEALTQAKFPDWEHRRDTKHEFVNGHVYRVTSGHLERRSVGIRIDIDTLYACAGVDEAIVPEA